MASCKDCLHYEPCMSIYKGTFAFADKACNHFADKSRFVELPCKVGDKMYVNFKGTTYPVYVYAIRQDHKKREQRVCVTGTFHMKEHDYNYSATFLFNSFGKTIFRTPEEAEAALAKRMKDGSK